MPPAKRAAVETSAPEITMLKKGALVNLEKGGRTLTNYKILDWDDVYVKFQGSLQVSPQTEIVLIPHAKIEGMGLVGEHA